MIQFNPKDLNELIDVNGILAMNVDGECVAIGRGFDYENINDLIEAYIKENELQAFIENLGYDSISDWLENTPNRDCLYDDCSEAFDFRGAARSI